jgi:hypothetical protein
MGDLAGHPTHPDRQAHPTNHGDGEPHLLNGGTDVLVNASLASTRLANTSHLPITPSVK